MNDMNYVIIGNGAAGVSAAEKLRKLDTRSRITILSAEKYPAYSKCLLPDYISGYVNEENMYYRSRDFYKKHNIDFYPDQKVVAVDFDNKFIITESFSNYSGNGTVFEYDKLLIATGSSPIIPKIKGLDEIDYYTLGTFDDAKRIARDAKAARRVVIIGAGFVGLETALNLYKMGKEVTVVERMPRILMNQLDEKAAAIIRDGLIEEGIRLFLNANVVEFSKTQYSRFMKAVSGNSGYLVILEDGSRLKADMIILAMGSKPNIPFIDRKSLEINSGIVVDKYMRTSIEDVYAAGDVAESIDAVTGKRTLSPIWPNAVIQGEFAAWNMAGFKTEFSEQINFRNASEFREIPMITMGVTSAEDLNGSVGANGVVGEDGADGVNGTNGVKGADGSVIEEYVDYRPFEKIYRKILIKDNVIIGMIFMGDIKNAGVVGGLMKNKVNVERFKHNLLNPNFGYSEVAGM